MGIVLKFHHPHFPQGHKFAINDLGVIENGGSLEVSDDQAAQFAASQGKDVNEAFVDNPHITVEGASSENRQETPKTDEGQNSGLNELFNKTTEDDEEKGDE